MRSLVMARIVDSYTNILTVKLFARLADEDAYVREAIDQHQLAIGKHMQLISQFMFWLAAMNAALLDRHRGGRHLAVGAGHGQRRRGRHRAAARLADRQRRRLGELGSDRHLREHRRGAGRHADHRRAAPRPRPPRRDASSKCRAARSASRTCSSPTAGSDAKPVLDHLSFTIRPGERVGLVGRSGAGKSTLVNLLLRFYELEQGAIRIDGQDIGGVTQESLRAAIGMVTQDTSLLHRSIADNIRYGRPGATDGRGAGGGAARRRRTSSSSACRTGRAAAATTRTWASAASSSPAASASASRSRAWCSRTRRSSCSTKPPRRWTAKSNSRSRSSCSA